MAKQSHARGAEQPVSLDLKQTEQRVREFLAAGAYRKAREEVKLLCKVDRPKFLPLLIEANQGLARDMLSKGQVSEAQQVLSYLRTIASPAQLRMIELDFAGKSGNGEVKVASIFPVLADPAAALSPADRLRMADTVIAAFHPLSAENPAGASMAAEVVAIQEALKAISDKQLERAQELVRPISQSSLFAHWKLFVKGLAAFHAGDLEKAARFLAELPADSVPGRARQPYLLLAREDMVMSQQRLSGAVVEAVCRLAGFSGWGRMLDLAEREWAAQRPSESYKLLRAGVAGFPSEQLDLTGLLTEFYFNSVFTLHESMAENYVQYFEELEERRNTKSSIELSLILRVISLYLEPDIDPLSLKISWEGFIRIREQNHGRNPRLASLAYGWLGERLAEEMESPGLLFSRRNASLRDEKLAISTLKKSLELDPANLASHLTLCQVYEALHMSSERTRLLEEMTERFPDNKEVLLQAGRRCLDEQADAKGLEHLQRAFNLDRLDPAVPDLIVSTLLKSARQSFQQGRLDQARQAWNRIQEFLVLTPQNLVRSRWTLLIRRGLEEKIFGDLHQGETLLVEARACSPFPAAYWFFAHLARRNYQPQSGDSFFANEFRSIGKREASIPQAVTLAHIYEYWHSTEPVPGPQEEKLFRKYLRAAGKRPFTRDEAGQLVRIIGHHRAFMSESKDLVYRRLKEDATDPLFRLYNLMLRATPAASQIPEIRDQLQRIIDDAVHRRDDAATQLGRQFLGALNSFPLDRPSFVHPDLEDEEEEDDDEESFEDEGSEKFSDLPPGVLNEMQEVISHLSNASDAEIRRFRKQTAKDIPNYVFDQLVEMARSGSSPTLPPIPSRSQASSAKSGSYPNLDPF